MFEFHTDKQRYFQMQADNARQYVVPFVEKYKAITPGTRVLEIGCAEAGVLKAFIEKGCVAVGVELEESRLVLAREFMKEELEKGLISFVSKDIYKVDIETELINPFSNSSFINSLANTNLDSSNSTPTATQPFSINAFSTPASAQPISNTLVPGVMGLYFSTNGTTYWRALSACILK